jgi:hypothetical protein
MAREMFVAADAKQKRELKDNNAILRNHFLRTPSTKFDFQSFKEDN